MKSNVNEITTDTYLQLNIKINESELKGMAKFFDPTCTNVQDISCHFSDNGVFYEVKTVFDYKQRQFLSELVCKLNEFIDEVS